MRLVFESAPEAECGELYQRFASEVAEPLVMEHRFAEAGRMSRVAVMASREDHCLLDLFWRFGSGELPGEPLMVISNHPDHEEAVRSLASPTTTCWTRSRNVSSSALTAMPCGRIRVATPSRWHSVARRVDPRERPRQDSNLRASA
jgi:formyltetrahydrofolate hydrolase